MPNVNVNVTARRGTADSDRSYTSQESQSLGSYQSSNPTSPLEPEQTFPHRQKLPPRSDPRARGGSHSRPRSVLVEDEYDPEEEEGASPEVIPAAPEVPGARAQAPLPVSRDPSEEGDRGVRVVQKHHKHKHSHKHHRPRTGRRRSPSETTEEMDGRPYQNEFGEWVQAPQQQHFPYPHGHVPPTPYGAPPSQHPGAPQQNMSLVSTSPYHQQAMYQPPAYPQPQHFYPQQMPQSPGMPMMGMGGQYFNPWSMMGPMQQQPSPPPTAEHSAEFAQLRAELEARKQQERQAYEEQQQLRRQIEVDRARSVQEQEDREKQAKAQAAAVAKALEDFKMAQEAEAAQKKAVADAKAEGKKAADEAATKKAKDKEEDHKKKLEEATKEKETAMKEAEDAKKEAEAAKGPPENELKVHVELCAPNVKSRKFNIPFTFSKNWKTMYPMLIEAYEGWDEKFGPKLADRMEDGHFEIGGPDGTTILPHYWDVVIKPDMEVKVSVRPEAPPQITHVQTTKHSKGDVHRTKSGKSKRKNTGVMFGEVNDIPSAAPGPPPPPMGYPEGLMGGPVAMVGSDDGSNDSVVIQKPKKKVQKPPGMMEALFGGGRRKKK